MENEKIVFTVLLVFTITNCISFTFMWYDKLAAKNKKWRVPEKTLFLAAIFFGGLGGVLGMKIFRHKTQHWYFRIFFPIILAVQILIIAFSVYFFTKI